MLDIVLVCEMTPQMRGHFCIRKEFLIFAFDVLTEVGIMGSIVTDGIRRVLGFEILETE